MSYTTLITTKTLPATDTLGTRVKAKVVADDYLSAEGVKLEMTYPWDYKEDASENHRTAAKALLGYLQANAPGFFSADTYVGVGGYLTPGGGTRAFFLTV